jgi:ABC-type transport system involved in multi-copper enzyme maturation permease subunit
MVGGTLALLSRSLRVDARLLRTHLFRLFFMALICISLLMTHGMSMVMSAPGLRFFWFITYLNFMLITLAGISFFASAITEEKEEGILGLLKMAGISRVGILLGKSTSRLISAMLLLLVQFPFTLLAITLGGVTLGQVMASYWALLAYMVFLANLGLVCSVFCRRAGEAATLTGLFLAAFFIIPPIGRSVLSTAGSGSEVEQIAATLFDWLYDASIFIRLNVIMTTTFAESAFSWQVISNFAAAFVLFFLSWAIFDRFTNDLKSSAPARGMLLTRSSRLRILRTSRVWRNALMWKDYYFLTGGKTAAVAKFVIYGLIVGIIGFVTLFEKRFPSRDEFSSSVVTAMLIAMTIELSVSAARIFHDEIKWKTLPAISLLPTSTVKIVSSKAAGCLLGLYPAMTFLALGAMSSLSGFLEVIVSPSTWFSLITFAIFIHLTAMLSLFVKWGALPLSLAIMFFLNTCCPVFFIGFSNAALGSESGWVILLALMAIFLYGFAVIFPLQLVIVKRFQTLASR